MIWKNKLWKQRKMKTMTMNNRIQCLSYLMLSIPAQVDIQDEGEYPHNCASVHLHEKEATSVVNNKAELAGAVQTEVENKDREAPLLSKTDDLTNHQVNNALVDNQSDWPDTPEVINTGELPYNKAHTAVVDNQADLPDRPEVSKTGDLPDNQVDIRQLSATKQNKFTCAVNTSDANDPIQICRS